MVRIRFVGVLAASALCLIAVGGFAGAQESSTIYACFHKSHGTLRTVADGDTCRDGEVAISWAEQGPKGEKGDPGDTGPRGLQGPQGEPGSDAVIGTGSILTEHLSQAMGAEAVATGTIRDGAVTDAKLGVFSAHKAFGQLWNATLPTTNLVGSLDSDMLVDGSVPGSKLQHGSVNGDRLALGTIRGEAATDNSLGPVGNLALRSIGSDNIALQGVTGENVDDATLGTRHLKSNASAGVGGSPTTLADGMTIQAVSAELVVIGSGTHTAMIVGDLAIDCSSCVNGDQLIVTLKRNGSTILTRSYSISEPQGMLVLPINAIDVGVPSATGSGTSSTFSVHLTYDTATGTGATAAVASSALTAVDLGD